jgi:hypothetical protein
MASFHDNLVAMEREIERQRAALESLSADRRRVALAPCRWSLLPRAYCAGCHRGHHDGEPKRYG